MRKMGKHKMIAKSCPKCELQVAVASKSCKCGHTFFASRRGADCLPAVEDIRRRTGRVRRSQPQFYDAQHYQKQIKRRSPKKRSLSRSMDEDNKPKDKNESGKLRKHCPNGQSDCAHVRTGRLPSRSQAPRTASGSTTSTGQHQRGEDKRPHTTVTTPTAGKMPPDSARDK